MYFQSGRVASRLKEVYYAMAEIKTCANSVKITTSARVTTVSPSSADLASHGGCRFD